MGLSGVRLGMSRNGLLDTQERLEVGTRDVLSQNRPDLLHPRSSLPLVCGFCEIWCYMVNTLLVCLSGDFVSFTEAENACTQRLLSHGTLTGKTSALLFRSEKLLSISDI